MHIVTFKVLSPIITNKTELLQQANKHLGKRHFLFFFLITFFNSMNI